MDNTNTLERIRKDLEEVSSVAERVKNSAAITMDIKAKKNIYNSGLEHIDKTISRIKNKLNKNLIENKESENTIKNLVNEIERYVNTSYVTMENIRETLVLKGSSPKEDIVLQNKTQKKDLLIDYLIDIRDISKRASELITYEMRKQGQIFQQQAQPPQKKGFFRSLMGFN